MAIAQPANLKGKHGEWQVYSQMEALDGMVRIYIIHGRETKRFIASFEKDGSITINEIQEGATPIKPTMMIPMALWYAISDLFGEVISPKIKEVIDAELKATKYHLEDMRLIALKHS